MFALLQRPLSHHLPAKFYEMLLDNSRSLIFVKDSEGRIIYCNRAFLELHAPDTRINIIGTKPIADFPEDDVKVFLEEDRKALENGFSEIVEELTDYQGQLHILQTQKTRIIDGRGRMCILGVATDITKLVMRERMLAQSNLALENFASVAAHDLRSPLAALVSSLNLVENDQHSRLSVLAHKHMALMTTCLEGLIAQVASLLQVNKISGEDPHDRVMCDLQILFEEVKFGLSNHIENASAKVLSSGLPVLKVNPPMFRQLIHNLIENALKYRGADTPIIVLRYTHQGGRHLFSIEDNGIGVDALNRERIFGMFAQANDTAEGFGIGLAHCRRIVEMHGGQIWLDETRKNGCCFCFTVPDIDY